jgi:hypothetical protein
MPKQLSRNPKNQDVSIEQGIHVDVRDQGLPISTFPSLAQLGGRPTDNLSVVAMVVAVPREMKAASIGR